MIITPHRDKNHIEPFETCAILLNYCSLHLLKEDAVKIRRHLKWRFPKMAKWQQVPSITQPSDCSCHTARTCGWHATTFRFRHKTMTAFIGVVTFQPLT